MKRAFVCLSLALLAACGVDGEPTPPGPAIESKPKPGITISGRAEIGVVKTSGG